MKKRSLCIFLCTYGLLLHSMTGELIFLYLRQCVLLLILFDVKNIFSSIDTFFKYNLQFYYGSLNYFYIIWIIRNFKGIHIM
jgi:hypothetical protein